jgi:hypothetical protein
MEEDTIKASSSAIATAFISAGCVTYRPAQNFMEAWV